MTLFRILLPLALGAVFLPARADTITCLLYGAPKVVVSIETTRDATTRRESSLVTFADGEVRREFPVTVDFLENRTVFLNRKQVFTAKLGGSSSDDGGGRSGAGTLFFVDKDAGLYEGTMSCAYP